ncbi:hypothetical protein Rhe02_58860 [Rhizocola hellebori]|uniref:Uncharacterized protein n=1 Tax=Rhizocola hellebori TaxID=1392758 RepID=A0A8J3QDM2_9ACTN|nr:hypothetical protein Rhe02_58860 [Rhizocola hellebori]
MRPLHTSTRAHPAHSLAAIAGVHRTLSIGSPRIHARVWLRHARYHVWKLVTAVVLAFGGWTG